MNDIILFRLPPLPYGAKRGMRNLVITLALLLVAVPAAAKTTILALGDSLTAGYGLPEGDGLVPQLNDWLAANGTDAVVLNAGVSGDTTAGGLARVDWALTPEVQAMIVTLGGNDLLRGLPPANARANIDAILAKAQTRNLPVLLVAMRAPGNFGPAYEADFNALYPDLAQKYGTLLVENFFAPIADGSGVAIDQSYIQPDGIHPNAEGVRRVVESLGPRVQELMERTAP
jgi:acyl-CoA thioesterase-1